MVYICCWQKLVVYVVVSQLTHFGLLFICGWSENSKALKKSNHANCVQGHFGHSRSVKEKRKRYSKVKVFFSSIFPHSGASKQHSLSSLLPPSLSSSEPKVTSQWKPTISSSAATKLYESESKNKKSKPKPKRETKQNIPLVVYLLFFFLLQLQTLQLSASKTQIPHANHAASTL